MLVIAQTKQPKIKDPNQQDLTKCWELMVTMCEARTLDEEQELLAEAKRLILYRNGVN